MSNDPKNTPTDKLPTDELTDDQLETAAGGSFPDPVRWFAEKVALPIAVAIVVATSDDD